MGPESLARSIFQSSNGGYREGWIILNFLGGWWDGIVYPSRDAAISTLGRNPICVSMRGKFKPKIVKARQTIEWGEKIRRG